MGEQQLVLIRQRRIQLVVAAVALPADVPVVPVEAVVAAQVSADQNRAVPLPDGKGKLSVLA